MGSNPINLALRFLLELSALIIVGRWGYKQSDNGLQWVFAIGLPILLAAIWGTFAVADDPSRSGNAPIPVPGFVRLAIELAFFAVATWALYNMGLLKQSLAFGCIVVLHYLISYDRIAWLMTK